MEPAPSPTEVMPSHSAAPAGTPRRPLPLPQICGTGLRGEVVLREFGEPMGVLLWHALRSAMLWTEAPVAERGQIFRPGAMRNWRAALRSADVSPAVRKPLEALARALRAGDTSDTLADACRRVSEWAGEQEKLGTALAFMQTAALVDPADARLAYEAGRLARKRAEYARAELWLARAIELGRVNQDWEFYARGFIGLGNLHFQRGSFPGARKFHGKALRAARQHGLREVEGEAAHELFVVADESGRFAEAEAYAAEALRAYSPAHPLLTNLAHDVASSWMNQGQFARALPVFRAVLPNMQQRRERLIVLGSVARAAGAIPEREIFDQAWTAVWTVLEAEPNGEGSTQALLDVARGAAGLRDWARAETAATRAEQIAEERREAHVSAFGETLLDSIRKHRQIGDPPRPDTDSARVAVSDALAAEFVALLEDAALSSG